MANNTTTTAVAQTGEFVAADPHTLVIDTNVRTAPTLDKKFAASVATRGVLLPVLATRDDDGTLRVRDGQLRTLAAQAANLATIPVYVISSAAADDAAEVERITDQLATNEQRTDLTDRHRAAAYQELFDLGLSATKIAKATHTSKKQVDVALTTASSAVAMEAVEQSLTLEQGAILAAYDVDADTDAVEALLAAATQGRFDHAAAELAENADERAALRAGRAALIEQGYQVATTRPVAGGRDGWSDLRQLYVAETGQDADDLDPATLTREHLLVWIDTDCEEQWTDADGSVVDERTVDWNVDGEPADIEAAGGMLDPRLLTHRVVWSALAYWYHNDPAVDGLENWNQRSERLAAEAADSGDAEGSEHDTTGRTGNAAELSARAAIEEKEAERIERRRTRILNQKAVAAQKVRRDKLRECLARKTLPKGKAAVVARFLAHTMWTHPDLYQINRADGSTREIAAELLGTDPLAALDGATAERTQIIALAMTCAAHEANLPKDAWRGGHMYDRTIGWARTRYLEFLTEAYGYTLAEVEQAIAGYIDPGVIDIS